MSQFWPNFHILGDSCANPPYRSGPNLAGNSRPTIYAYIPNFIWIHLLCQLPETKNCNFGQIWTFGGFTYQAPFTDEGQVWCARTHPQSMLNAYVSNFVLIALFSHPLAVKTPKFCSFLPFLDFAILWCHHLALIWESWTWLQNYKPSPNQRYQNHYSNAFMAKSCAQTLTFKSMTDWQTGKNVFGCPGGWWNPIPTELCVVIEDLKRVIAPRKLLQVQRIVLPLRGTENLVETHPSN